MTGRKDIISTNKNTINNDKSNNSAFEFNGKNMRSNDAIFACLVDKQLLQTFLVLFD